MSIPGEDSDHQTVIGASRDRAVRGAIHTARFKSVPLRHQVLALQFVVVTSLVGPPGQSNPLAGNCLIWNQVQKMRDAVKPCSFFVVGTDDEPRSIFGMRRLYHHVAGPRVLIPAAKR